MTIVNELFMYARLARGLRSYLRQPPWTSQSAGAAIMAGLHNREERFLTVVREQAYDNPSSPYRRLLSWAGCEMGDLIKSVQQDGLEPALEELEKAGVYVTLDEFKGFVPIKRGSLEFSVRNSDFDNCRGTPDFFVQTSGSTKLAVHVPEYLPDLVEQSPFWAVLRKGLDLERHRMAIWYPLGGVSIKTLLSYRKTGELEKWFSLTNPALKGLPLRYRWSSEMLSAWCRLMGSRVPSAEPGGLAHLDKVLNWCLSGGPTCLSALTSSIVRLCHRALERGVTLADSCLLLAGEPLNSEGRLIIEQTGATKAALYATAETGHLGVSCAAPDADIGDYHFRADRYVLSEQRPDDPTELPAILLTTLAPLAGKFMLNAQIGDTATIRTDQCGCYLDQIGLTQHISQISSLAKVVAEGMTLLKSKVAPVLENLLPIRLGGLASDYQLVQTGDPDGIERLELWVSPEIQAGDEAAIVNTFLTELLRLEAGMHVVVDVWRQANTVRVVRKTPIPVGGKFPSIRIDAR